MAKRNQAKEEKGRLTLFLGPFQPELEDAFLERVRTKKEKDRFAPLVVLVGSNLLGLHLQRQLVWRGLEPYQLRFLTFIDLARALAAEPLDREGSGPSALRRSCPHLLPGRKIQAGSYFGPIADRRGFQRALSATFRDLADGGIETPAFLENPEDLRTQRPVPGLPFARRPGFTFCRTLSPRGKRSSAFSRNLAAESWRFTVSMTLPKARNGFSRPASAVSA
jgi:hypothetical protein